MQSPRGGPYDEDLPEESPNFLSRLEVENEAESQNTAPRDCNDAAFN
jgi:hypothetical protein